jgi:integrase
MPSVFHKAGRGKRWFANFIDASGKRVHGVPVPFDPEKPMTKPQARDWARDREREAEEQRKRPAPASDAGGGTVANLLKWWLAAYSAHTPSHENTSSSVLRHLLTSELATMRLADLTSADVTRFLRAKRLEKSARGKPFSLQTIAHMRTHLLCAFNRAIEEGRWNGENPIIKSKAKDKKEKKAKRVTDYLHVEEVEPLLAALDPRWRPLFAVCIFLGLRKGEALALRKADVDRARRVLLVRRSWERDVTKNGEQAEVPIPDAALPWLDEAAAASPSEFLFPHVCVRRCKPECKLLGTMMRRDIPLQEMLRRALGRAGIVQGYFQKCRKRGCKHRQETADPARCFCPEHSVLLWPVAKVRPLRFHDLRRTCASLLQMGGGATLAASKLLRHASTEITEKVYTEVEPVWLREQVNRMPIQVGHLLPERSGDKGGTDRLHGQTKAPNPSGVSEEDSGLSVRAIQDSNLWPLAPEAKGALARIGGFLSLGGG